MTLRTGGYSIKPHNQTLLAHLETTVIGRWCPVTEVLKKRWDWGISPDHCPKSNPEGASPPSA